MKFDVMTYGMPLADTPAAVRRASELGYDGWLVGETNHDSLLACAAAGQAGTSMEIGTAITIAFARSPMQVAYAAHDLQALTGGRFILGLGSQIKAHIEKRYGGDWHAPAPRMREYIQALHAIWTAWRTGERLQFRGKYTRHTLMSPFFVPPAHGYADPQIWLAAVGPAMTRVAGEIADGMLCHVFTTAEYFADVTLPRLREGAESAGRSFDDLDIAVPLFIVTGDDERTHDEIVHAVRGQIAFYGSTPAYRGVLEHHGWGDLHQRLHEASLAGAWDRMPALIPDEVLDAFAIVAEPDRLAGEILRRFGDRATRVSAAMDLPMTDETVRSLLADVRATTP